jgi:branched-chain amino acid transport system permease protein
MTLYPFLLPGYLIPSIVYGSLFALMAMGLTLTYMTTKVPNFAYGSFITVGLYVTYTLRYLSSVGPYAATAVAFAVTGGVSLVMYLTVLRPLARRGTPLVALMIATFGVDIGFTGIFGIYTDYLKNRYGLSDSKQFFALPGDFKLFGLQGVEFVAPLSVVIVTLFIYLLFTRTKFGIAMRASVENSPLAKILGINVELVNVVSWIIAGGFAGLAGALYALWLPGGTSTGSDLIVQIFAASILGGLGSIFGAVAGGLVVGASQDVVTTWLGQGFGLAITVAFAIAFIGFGISVLLRRVRLPTVKVGDVIPWDILNRNVLVSGQGAFGAASILAGAYILVEISTGYATDFFVQGLVNGYGAGVLPFETAIPLIILVITLMMRPQGIASIKFGRLRRKK